jgi:hypothetical protein
MLPVCPVARCISRLIKRRHGDAIRRSWKRLVRSNPFRISWHGIRDSPMNLLTNGFVNNCGRLFGPAEEFEADIVRVEAEGILCEWR